MIKNNNNNKNNNKYKYTKGISNDCVPIRLGLKGALSETLRNYKGCGIRYIINIITTLLHEFKFAYQRAMYGFDVYDVVGFNSSIVNRLLIIIEDFKNNNKILFFSPNGYEIGEYDEQTNRYYINKEVSDTILETLIFHLKMSDEDYVTKQLYGKNIYDDDYDFNKILFKDYVRIENVRKQNQDRAFDLIKLFIDQLWF